MFHEFERSSFDLLPRRRVGESRSGAPTLSLSNDDDATIYIYYTLADRLLLHHPHQPRMHSRDATACLSTSLRGNRSRPDSAACARGDWGPLLVGRKSTDAARRRPTYSSRKWKRRRRGFRTRLPPGLATDPAPTRTPKQGPRRSRSSSGHRSGDWGCATARKSSAEASGWASLVRTAGVGAQRAPR